MLAPKVLPETLLGQPQVDAVVAIKHLQEAIKVRKGARSYESQHRRRTTIVPGYRPTLWNFH